MMHIHVPRRVVKLLALIPLVTLYGMLSTAANADPFGPPWWVRWAVGLAVCAVAVAWTEEGP